MIGAIDTGRIINRIGINAPTFLREFYPSILRTTEIAALRHNFTAQLVAINTEGVTRFVTDLGMGFERSFDVSADTTVVEQIHRCLQDSAQQFNWRNFRDIDTDNSACLST